MSEAMPFWVELLVSLLLMASGVFVMISAVGFWRLRDFFVRMHPTALAYTGGTWCVALASVVAFSAIEGQLALYPLLVVVIMAITVPVTTVLLARVALFRRRTSGAPNTPLALSAPEGER
ncbi:MAG: Na+/H+ antiporter subunit G [Gemmatimonas sp.]